ncbi:BLUF domain-containing protein [Tunicatimonas pelagia]|uniref:BLUF domain-containing protein n=1 Tax=Tunicatimonas pelagia TaxID=931531 RepID=UPI002665C4A3|nr:BLUF domain-containing protein [Tunicatimonas pelagia]WKN41716.1 BLUF domain-containing protein [Tunicatimonas pelagia]
MYALVYISEANQSFSMAELRTLAKRANWRNKLLSITGFLTYKDGQFLQYLEGEEKTVISLMNTIRQDSRHTVVKLIELPDQPQQYLVNWHMRYLSGPDLRTVNLEDLLADTLKKLDSGIYSQEKILQLVHSILSKFSRYFADNPLVFSPPL